MFAVLACVRASVCDSQKKCSRRRRGYFKCSVCMCYATSGVENAFVQEQGGLYRESSSNPVAPS